MQYSKLGSANIDVSRVCLGSMTWGCQNSQADADAQLDYALAQGVNFIDTAEMYAVPPTADTYGATERIIGNWLSRNPAKRKELVLASKMAGSGLAYIRGGGMMTPSTLVQAVDASLARLQTDYIDLYQLHWPERKTNFFGQRGFKSQEDAWEDNIHSVLETLERFIAQGKIKTRKSIPRSLPRQNLAKKVCQKILFDQT